MKKHFLLLLGLFFTLSSTFATKYYNYTKNDFGQIEETQPEIKMSFFLYEGKYYAAFESTNTRIRFTTKEEWKDKWQDETEANYGSYRHLYGDNNLFMYCDFPKQPKSGGKIILSIDVVEKGKTNDWKDNKLEFTFPNDIEWFTPTLYFVNQPGWTTPHAHIWNDNGLSTEWPGKAMTNTGLVNSDGQQIWKVEFGMHTKVKFNKGNDGGLNSDEGAMPADGNNLQNIMQGQFFQPAPEGNTANARWYAADNLYIPGDMTNWNTRNNDSKFSAWDGSSTTVSWKKFLNGEQDYAFKIYYYDGSTDWWRSNNGTMTESNCSGWFMGGSDDNCKLHTTYYGVYTFRYDFTTSRLSVDYPQSMCEGSGLTHFASNTMPKLDYIIEFEDDKVTVVATPTDGGKITFFQVSWYIPDLIGAQNLTTTESDEDGAAKISFSPKSINSNADNHTVYMLFLWDIEGQAGRSQSSENLIYTDPNIISYKLGDCPKAPAETDPPCMRTATLQSHTSSSAILNVSADDNGQPTPIKFVVSDLDNGLAATEYIATDGKITVTGLQPCTEYNLTVSCIDRQKNRSTDNTTESCRSITLAPFKTDAETGNIALNKSVSSSYENNINQTSSKAIDGDFTTRWGSEGSGQLDYITVDLGSVQNIDHITIYWQTACATDYEIMFSLDGTEYNTVFHQTAEPTYYQDAPTNSNNAMTHQLVSAIPARYVRIKANAAYNNNAWGISIWELEVYGSDQCYEPDTEAPRMLTAEAVDAEATKSSVTISVTAEDDKTNPVWIYEIEGVKYYTTNGKISFDGLQPCTTYQYDVYAIDNAGNKSENHLVATAHTTSISASENLALGKSATVGATAEGDIANLTNEESTNSWRSGGTKDKWWFTIDLGAIYMVNQAKIYWINACPSEWAIYYSTDNSHFYEAAHYYTAPTIDTYTNYALPHAPARYIKVQAMSVLNADWGMGAADIQIFGTGECLAVQTALPEMATAEESNVTERTATIEVSATDTDQTEPIDIFVANGRIFNTTDGKITIDGLNPCLVTNFAIYAMDNYGNLSNAPINLRVQAAAASATTNIALRHATYAGFVEGGCPKDAAVDGMSNTRWATSGIHTMDEEWLVIDLGGDYKIDSIAVEWEYGTSLNYEFQVAYNAEFERVSDIRDRLTSGEFATFDHRTDEPEGSKIENINYNEKGHADATHIVDGYSYRDRAVQGRFLKVASTLMGDFATSMWEIRVFGQCADPDANPMMQWAEVLSASTDEALLYVSAIDRITLPSEMSYRLEVTGGEEGYRVLNTEYYFTPEQFYKEQTGQLLLGGLLPDVPYTVDIYAVNKEGVESQNKMTVTFRTSSADGCVYESDKAFKVGSDPGSKRNFQKGYRLIVSPSADHSSFTVEITSKDVFYKLTDAYLQWFPDKNAPTGTTCELHMTKKTADDDDLTWIATIDASTAFANGQKISSWSGEIEFLVKLQFHNGGIVLTQPVYYDLENGCSSQFVIYQHDSQPASTARIAYEGGTIDKPIRYYRLFTPMRWEDMYLPFEVDSVRVYDTWDHVWHSLYPEKMHDGIITQGYYLLRKQVPNVSGAEFKDSWYSANDDLPQKDTPYSIRFSLDFYSDKYVVFYSSANKVIGAADSFSKGTAPTNDDEYLVYGNTTLDNVSSIGKAYILTNPADQTYHRVPNANLYPFQTYVLANNATIGIMQTIGPWHSPALMKPIEDEEEPLGIVTNTNAIGENDVYQQVRIYNLSGQQLGSFDDTTMAEVFSFCHTVLPTGMYIINTNKENMKLIIR